MSMEVVTPLSAQNSEVRVATVTRDDLAPYRRAVTRSASRLAHWNPVDPGDLEYHLRHQSSVHRTFLIHTLTPLTAPTDHDLVGRVNVTNITRGRAMSATLGYDSYDPYAGHGLFVQGLGLIVDLVFAPEPLGLGLRRVEANVQPGNIRSAAVLRSLGFTRRGSWRDYLYLPDATGASAWRDHVTYGMTYASWPAAAYAVSDDAAPTVILYGGEGAQAQLQGLALATELRAAWLPPSAVHALGRDEGEALPAFLRQPCGVVVGLDEELRAAWGGAGGLLAAAGIDPARALVVHDPSVVLASPGLVTRAALQAQALADGASGSPSGE
jgi:RimJ/RimL family protein N-acetyltransferase